MERSKQFKRPRSTTPIKVVDTPKKKKSKKKKSADSPGEEQTTTTRKRDASRDTSTKDGEIMTQMLSTFSKTEQSRFEAFQRSSLDPKVVKTWLEQLLSHRYGLGEVRELSNLVSPGQASDITMIMGVLAKIHAQRLVGRARKLKQGNEALTVQDIRRAIPDNEGFFMQATRDLQLQKEYEEDRQAALAAQEAYDNYVANKMDEDHA